MDKFTRNALFALLALGAVGSVFVWKRLYQYQVAQASEHVIQPMDVPVLLRYNVKVGSTWCTRVDSEIMYPNGTVEGFNGIAEIECIAATAEGAEFKAILSNADIGAYENDEPLRGNTVIETTKDARGKTLSYSVNGTGISVQEGIGTSDLLLPEKPVKSGDSWEALIKSPPIEATITYTLMGRTQYEGRAAYLITGSFKSGEMLEDDPGYTYIVDSETLQTLKLTGGFKGKDGYRGRFTATQVSE